MRPLMHPAAEDITLEGILYALSDPVRLALFISLLKADCPKKCIAVSSTLDVDIPKSTLSQHFKVLRDAGLIYSERKGVEMHNHTRCPDLKPRFGELIDAIVAAHTR